MLAAAWAASPRPAVLARGDDPPEPPDATLRAATPRPARNPASSPGSFVVVVTATTIFCAGCHNHDKRRTGAHPGMSVMCPNGQQDAIGARV